MLPLNNFTSEHYNSTSLFYPIHEPNSDVHIFVDKEYSSLDRSNIQNENEFHIDNENDENIPFEIKDIYYENCDNTIGFSDSVDPIEKLLMSTASTASAFTTINAFDFKMPSDLYTSQTYSIDFSPTYGTKDSDVFESVFNDNESVYQYYENNDCDSLHDYSSISNIIYTNKIKEKLRQKRHSVDLATSISASNLINKDSKKISKNNLLNNNSRRSKSRSKSVGSIALSRVNNLSISLSTETINGGDSTSIGKGTNPFYHPPEILKRLSHSD